MLKVIDFGKQMYKQIIRADVFRLSAQLAYFLLLSLFPFLLFLVTLLGYLPINEAMLKEFIETYAPTEITHLINTNLSQMVNTQHTCLLLIWIVATLWSDSNRGNMLTKALNRAYSISE